MADKPLDTESQKSPDIENQTIHGGSQQFADTISNQNREIATSVYVEGNAKGGYIAGRDLHINYYPPSEPTQPKTQTPKLFNVPIPRNPFFTGRSDILTKLHEALHESHEIAVTPSKKATALSGLGGVGKTQTVAEYAHRYQDDYSAVLWVLSDGKDLLRSSFANLSPLLGLKAEKQDDQILAVQSWLRHNDGWLLIFDNAETLELLNAAKELLPVDGKGHVLFTTRAQATGQIAAVSVDCFDDETGSVFLLRRSKWKNLQTLYLKAMKVIRHFLSNLAGCIFTIIFGLLQVWPILIISHITNVPLPAKKLFMDGALLFFSTAVVSSLAVDYYYFTKKSLLGYHASEHFKFVAFPFIIIISSLILFITCYILDTFKPEIKINQPLINATELGIITSTLAYSFFLKSKMFKSESEGNN